MLNIYSNMYIDREWDTYTGMQYHLLLCQTEMYERVGEWRLCVFVWNQVQGVTPGGGGGKKLFLHLFRAQLCSSLHVDRALYLWLGRIYRGPAFCISSALVWKINAVR